MKRPWNLPNMPVYSLATYDQHNCVNMNICTYVSAVSMNPKRYMVAVYYHTKTLSNLEAGGACVLQLLGKQHISVVNVLGKKSGTEVDKQKYLNKRELLTQWNNLRTLKDAAALVALSKLWSRDAGDHTVFLFDVTKFATQHEEVLTLDDLRAKKMIRI